MMALSPGSLVIRTHMTTGTFGTFAQMHAYLYETLLHGMPMQEADEVSMEGQGR